MELNATLFGQIITFLLFIWFTMRYVWPPITKALAERKQQIAEGLAAAERGKHELELAQHRAADFIREAKIQAANIVEVANKRATHIVEEAKEKARVEGERLLTLSKIEIDKELQKTKQALKDQVAMIAMAGAEKILAHTIDSDENAALLEKLITEI